MSRLLIRPTRPDDAPAIEAVSRKVYPHDAPWTAAYVARHLEVFPAGQLVAVDAGSGAVVGMAASLRVRWDDYDHLDDYNDFTDTGFFTNHDPTGPTLYGAEVMVDPDRRRQGIGSRLYEARFALARRLGVRRIRAGARLPGYHRHAGTLTAQAYVQRVLEGALDDPTLSFQLRHGFTVIGVVPNYFDRDPRSRGYAAIIEWLNPGYEAARAARQATGEARQATGEARQATGEARQATGEARQATGEARQATGAAS